MIHMMLAVAVPYFTQLSLRNAQESAVQRSPDVAIARAKVAEAQANFDEARAAYAPALTANYALAPQGVALDQTVEQHLTTVGAQIALGDILAASPAIAEANAQLLAARFGLADAERTERLTLIARFFGDLDARAQVDARAAALRDAQAQLRAAQLRFRSGDAPRLDAVRAEVAVENARADLSRAQAVRDNADAALAQEIAADPAELVTQEREIAVPPVLPLSVTGSVRTALALRPEIAAAHADVAAEERAVELARRGGIPLLTLDGGYARGVDSGVAVSGPSANVTLTVPLGGAAHARVAAEAARLAQAQFQEEKIRRAITLEVGDAVRTLDAQDSAFVAAGRALADARDEYRATQIGYRNGASSGLDVEAARSAYVAALVAELSAYYAQAQARATLQLLVGDGHG